MILEQAVEAAARAMRAIDVREGRGDYPIREYAADAKAILEAAAPHMLAEAWDDGATDGHLYGIKATNPYRPTP